MSLLKLSEGSAKPQKTFALFELAFRPFFLGAGLSAIVLIALWLLILNNLLQVGYYNPIHWHAHEMLLGYTGAIIAGFLLTAIRNWTSVQTIQHWKLAILAAIWVSGRMAVWLPLPPLLIASIDLLFFPLVAIAAALPILRIKQYSNLIFIPILLGLSVANLLIHLEALKITSTGMMGIRLAITLIILLILVMGTRVIPFFIMRGAQLQTPLRQSKKIDIAGNLLFIIWGLCYSFFPTHIITAYSALIAGFMIGFRLWGWHHPKLWKTPMLWILFMGFAFIPLGLILKFISYYQPQINSFAIHALTTGAMGILTLGMASRVSLGHSGRSIEHNKLIVLSFICIVLAALVRISPALPVLLPYTHIIYLISGGLWIIAFSCFVLYFAKILWQPRLDGQAG